MLHMAVMTDVAHARAPLRCQCMLPLPFTASATISHPLPVSLSIHLCMLVLGMEHAGDMEEEGTWRKRRRQEEE